MGFAPRGSAGVGARQTVPCWLKPGAQTSQVVAVLQDAQPLGHGVQKMLPLADTPVWPGGHLGGQGPDIAIHIGAPPAAQEADGVALQKPVLHTHSGIALSQYKQLA